MNTSTMAAALTYINAGLSVIPCRAGDKRPHFKLLPQDSTGRATWEPYQEGIAGNETVRTWFENGANIAIVAGMVSGGLMIFDFDYDAETIFPLWKRDIGTIAQALVIVKSPKGYHAYGRFPAPLGNTVLAEGCINPGEDDPAKRIFKTLIETRGEGGYIIAPPSVYNDHTYTVIQGDLNAIAFFDQETFNFLLAAAQAFNERPPVEYPKAATTIINHHQPSSMRTLGYARAALNGECLTIEKTQKGGRNKQLNRSSFRMGRFIGSGFISQSEVENALYYAAQQAGLTHKESINTMRSGIEDGITESITSPIVIPDNEEDTDPDDSGYRASGPSASRPLPQAEPPAETPKKKPSRLIHADKLDELPPLTWLVPGEIPLGGFVVVYGPSGGGKSFVVMNNYAMPLAQSMPVVYVAAEGASGYAHRKNAWCQFYQKDSGQLYFLLEPVYLLRPDSLYDFLEECKELQPKLIIFDTLARCMRGGDENDARDMGEMIDAASILQRTIGATVMVIHHTGASGARERGSTALRGAADVMIEVTPQDDVTAVFCSKNKDAKPFDPQYYRLVESGPSCVVLPSNNVTDRDSIALTTPQRKILETLMLDTFSDVGAKAAILSTQGGVSEGSIWRVLSSLMKRGYIRQDKKGDPYFITPKGRNRIEEAEDASHYGASLPTSLPESVPSSPSSNHYATITPANHTSSHLHHHHPPLRGDGDGDGDGTSNGKQPTSYEVDQEYARQARSKLAAGDLTMASIMASKISGAILQAHVLSEINAIDQGEFHDH